VIATVCIGTKCISMLTGPMPDQQSIAPLTDYLRKIPGVTGVIGSGFSDAGCWWVKFTIDLDHSLSWSVVQELAYVLNYLSPLERLPTVFMPVSPPPYMNGGPRDYLSWVIESKDKCFTPQACMEWLEGRLPSPVDDVAQWVNE
jgi:hypothetical protein